MFSFTSWFTSGLFFFEVFISSISEIITWRSEKKWESSLGRTENTTSLSIVWSLTMKKAAILMKPLMLKESVWKKINIEVLRSPNESQRFAHYNWVISYSALLGLSKFWFMSSLPILNVSFILKIQPLGLQYYSFLDFPKGILILISFAGYLASKSVGVFLETSIMLLNFYYVKTYRFRFDLCEAKENFQ